MNDTHSLPIKIQSTGKLSNDEYCLKQNFFNPNSSSPPPSRWNKRLIERIGNSYEYKHLHLHIKE